MSAINAWQGVPAKWLSSERAIFIVTRTGSRRAPPMPKTRNTSPRKNSWRSGWSRSQSVLRKGWTSKIVTIFAFPVQQLIVEIGRGREWAFAMYLGLSFLITGAMAYLSWHLVEKPALRFKPLSRSSNRLCKQHG